MKKLKIVPKILKLIFLLLVALTFDLLLYSFTSVCPACSNFSQFLTTPASLTGPLLASLTALTGGLTRKEK